MVTTELQEEQSNQKIFYSVKVAQVFQCADAVKAQLETAGFDI